MRRRLLLLTSTIAVSAAVLAAVSGASEATAGRTDRAPLRRSAPSIAGKPEAGELLWASPGRWRGARRLSYGWERCNAAAARCVPLSGAAASRRFSVRAYRLTVADVGFRIRVTVRATNPWGATSARSRATAVVRKAGAGGGSRPGSGHGKGSGPSGGGSSSTPPSSGPGGGGTTTTPSSSPPGGGTTPGYFSTVPSSETGTPPAGIPRSDSTCAAEVTPMPENRPQNTTANHSVPSDPGAITWSPTLDYWTSFVADRNDVTGAFTGTTDEILQWVACKWGIDENVVRADAVVESDWVQSTTGDDCGVAGEASYGILQVKNKDCSGDWVHGGWPYTQDDTALDADYWGARMRACFDGAFYNGGTWLYGGQTIGQVIAAHGEDYALWGCLGAWYSGNWYDSGAQSYIAKVQADYQSKPWLNSGF